MRRTLFLAAALLAALGGNGAAQTSTEAEPFHVFMVMWRGVTDVEHGFRAHMRERGIRVRYTYRNIDRDRSKIPGIVEEIRDTQPDLVHTFGTSATLGILGPRDGEPGAHVEGIPGVFSIVSYPVRANVVESFESTGRPVTGTAFLAPLDTQLDALLEYRPIETLGMIYNPLEQNAVTNAEIMRDATGARGIEFLEAPVPLDAAGEPDPGRLDELVADLAARGAQFLYMGPDSFATVHKAAISSLAVEHGLPVFAGTDALFRDSQAMVGLVSQYYLIGKLAGTQAERILVGGERPEDLPVASLARFALLIRMPVALRLGVYPPLDLLRVAQVVQS